MYNSFTTTTGSIWKGFESGKIKHMIKEYLFHTNKFWRNCWALRLCNLCYPYFVKGGKFDAKIWKDNYEREKEGIEEFHKFYIEISESDDKAGNKFKEAFKNEEKSFF